MRCGQKRLMILGAGYEQLPAIVTARLLGHFVITVDYLPQNVGHRHADRSVNVSTVEKEKVLASAKKMRIDGVFTFASDVAVPTVAHVAEKLGLQGCGSMAAERMCNKGLFRAMQHAAGLNSPQFAAGTEFEGVSTALTALGGRLVFKPADASGSRGIGSVEGVDFRAWKNAFSNAKRYARSGGVCVESFIDGADIGCNGFLFQGRLKFAVFTQKSVSAFVVNGHFLPAALSKSQHAQLVREIEETCAAAGYRNGPLDADLRLSDNGATVVEMSPRLGGNGIPELISRATQTDITKMAIAFALGEPVFAPESRKTETCCGSYIFGSPVSGVIHRIASETDILALIPEVFACSIRYRKGDWVPAFDHGGSSIGRVSFCCKDRPHYERVVAAFLEALDLKVMPS